VQTAVTSTSPTSTDTKSADTKSADTKSADTKSADTKSADTKSSTARRRAGSRRAPDSPRGPYAQDEKFLAEQRQLLETERSVYLAQASDLKAEADSLAQEREPGDVQFDEESGEGGTVTVDRERDLALSAQALAAVGEIDAALAKIADGTYGVCERCGQPIPKPRLKALPYARLCVACKSGGLSRR
jgi:DnaK suppressor protein